MRPLSAVLLFAVLATAGCSSPPGESTTSPCAPSGAGVAPPQVVGPREIALTGRLGTLERANGWWIWTEKDDNGTSLRAYNFETGSFASALVPCGVASVTHWRNGVLFSSKDNRTEYWAPPDTVVRVRGMPAIPLALEAASNDGLAVRSESIWGIYHLALEDGIPRVDGGDTDYRAAPDNGSSSLEAVSASPGGLYAIVHIGAGENKTGIFPMDWDGAHWRVGRELSSLPNLDWFVLGVYPDFNVLGLATGGLVVQWRTDFALLRPCGGGCGIQAIDQNEGPVGLTAWNYSTDARLVQAYEGASHCLLYEERLPHDDGHDVFWLGMQGRMMVVAGTGAQPHIRLIEVPDSCLPAGSS